MRKWICIETFPSYHHTDLEQGKNLGMLAFIFKTVVLSRAMMPMVHEREKALTTPNKGSLHLSRLPPMRKTDTHNATG